MLTLDSVVVGTMYYAEGQIVDPIPAALAMVLGYWLGQFMAGFFIFIIVATSIKDIYHKLNPRLPHPHSPSDE